MQCRSDGPCEIGRVKSPEMSSFIVVTRTQSIDAHVPSTLAKREAYVSANPAQRRSNSQARVCYEADACVFCISSSGEKISVSYSSRPGAPQTRVATLSLKSLFACFQTRALRRSLSSSRLGSSWALNASDASLGSRDGR